MEVIKRTGLATLGVVLVLLAFASFGGTKSAQAFGPYNGPYSPTCVQSATVYNWQWQFDGYTWRWVSVPTTVCVRWVTSFIRPYTPVYPTYPVYPNYPPVFYTPINNCLQPLPGGGFYNGCGFNQVYYRYW